MSNIKQFPNRMAEIIIEKGKTEVALMTDPPPAEQDIYDILVAVAYYVSIEDQKKARTLLNLVSGYPIVPIELELSPEHSQWVEDADHGAAMFPEVLYGEYESLLPEN